MFGHLIPSSGGEAIPLRKRRLYLGRRKDLKAGPAGPEGACCQLEMIDGWWHVEDLGCPGGVKVNGRACKRQRLVPNDEIAIGRHRFRIAFEAPRFPLGKYRSVGFAAAQRPPAESGSIVTRAQRKAERSGPLGRLIPVGGGKDIPLLKPRVTIGRKPPCDVILKYPTVSSRHCLLELKEGYWRVEDLGSHNGVRVDGVKCASAWVLPGSRLSIAEHRFKLDYEGSGPPPAPETVESGPKQSLMDKIGVSQQRLEQAMEEKSVRDSDTAPQRRWDVSK